MALAPVDRPLPLLDLPPNVLLGVFAELTELADAGERAGKADALSSGTCSAQWLARQAERWELFHSILFCDARGRRPKCNSTLHHHPHLASAVALSSCCRELRALGGAARRRHLCCAACGHALCDAAQALASETHREAPPLRLPDGTGVALDPQHCTGCRLSQEQPLEALETLLFLRVG